MALGAPAQNFVPLKEVRDGVAILKDGSMRAIILTSSINFALKSEDNQQAIIMQFQNFLNSLDFSVQIFIQSRRLDIRPYLALLEDRYKAQTNDLLKLQIREYIEFIRKFTEGQNIMAKSFFVVIPYSPAIIGGKGIGDSIGGALGGKTKDAGEKARALEEQFAEHRTQLMQRVGVVASGLAGAGIRSVELGSDEIIELFYKIFNPGETEKPLQMK